MPGDPTTHDAHRVRLTNEATQETTEATLWLKKGSIPWQERGDLDLHEEIESGTYMVKMIDSDESQRLLIERDGDRYKVWTLSDGWSVNPPRSD